MKINGKEIKAKYFVFDGCHKIYLIEDNQDIHEAQQEDYDELIPIEKLPEYWEKSCPLRFIYNWKWRCSN